MEALTPVSGFFELGCVEAYETIDRVQRDAFGLGTAERTALCEIGVYHGRSFLALTALRAKTDGREEAVHSD